MIDTVAAWCFVVFAVGLNGWLAVVKMVIGAAGCHRCLRVGFVVAVVDALE